MAGGHPTPSGDGQEVITGEWRDRRWGRLCGKSSAQLVHHAGVNWHQGGRGGGDLAVGEGQHSSAGVFVDVSELNFLTFLYK